MNHLEILKLNKDEKYIDFLAKIIPTEDKDFFIGVRTPIIRKILKENKNDFDFYNGLINSNFDYYEERLLFSFYISDLKCFEDTIVLTKKYLNYCDNWALTDSLRPKIWKKNKEKLRVYLDEWFGDSRIYVKRFSIGIYMYYFLGDDFNIEDFKKITSLETEDYYLEMMIAWYISEALVNNKEYVINLLESKTLSKSIQNKAIQKAVDSRRVTTACKEHLKTLRI